MIFVTVGTQLPFPRLIGAMSALAPVLDEEIVAQTGSDIGAAEFPGLDLRTSLAPAEFDALFAAARVVVAHAGIGTILSAKRLGRPLIILPRRHDQGEHRNDHQLATARQVERLEGIHVAWDVEDLGRLLGRADLTPAGQTRSASHDALISRVQTFIAS